MGVSTDHIIVDGLNLLIPSVMVSPMYNSKYINVFPIIYFLRTIFKVIISTKNVEFNFLVRNNLYEIFSMDNVKLHVVFDLGADISRRKINNSYKKDRKLKRRYSYGEESDVHNEIIIYRKILSEILQSMGVNVYMIPFVEADPIIAYITNIINKSNNTGQVIIISNDSDFYELFGKIMIYDPKQKKFIIDSPEDRCSYYKKIGLLKSDTEFCPSLSNNVYFKTILGERVDNINRVKIKKHAVRKVFYRMVNENINKIQNFDEFWNLLSETLRLSSTYYTDIYENYRLISLRYYIENMMSPHDCSTIKSIYSENNSFDIKTFLKYMDELELNIAGMNWLVI